MLCVPSDETQISQKKLASPRLLARLFHKSTSEDKKSSQPNLSVKNGCDLNLIYRLTDNEAFPPAGYNPTAVGTLLANALDLTAPASDVLLKNRRNPWVQLAGHPDSFAPAGPHTVWKKLRSDNTKEPEVYRDISHDTMKAVVPKFYRLVTFNGEHFMELEDLLQNFYDPFVMDVKLGTRTFLESEASNPSLRSDLYDKMVKVDPQAPTVEEHQAKAITKLRYMQFREQESSSAEYGFRIDAMKTDSDPIEQKKLKTLPEVSNSISQFLNQNESVRRKMLHRLKEIRHKLEKSKYFLSHEVIGSSLLFLYDSKGKAGVWMIDFAKTFPVEGEKLTHRKPWALGNREDGYLLGLDNLISVFTSLRFTKCSPTAATQL